MKVPNSNQVSSTKHWNILQTHATWHNTADRHHKTSLLLRRNKLQKSSTIYYYWWMQQST